MLSTLRAGLAARTVARVPRKTTSEMLCATKTMVLRLRSSRFIFSRVSAGRVHENELRVTEERAYDRCALLHAVREPSAIAPNRPCVGRLACVACE